MYVGSDQLQSLLMARRLVLLTRQIEINRQSPNSETQSFKDILDQDEVQLSGGLDSSSSDPDKVKPAATQVTPDYKLSDISKRVSEMHSGLPPEGTTFEKLA